MTKKRKMIMDNTETANIRLLQNVKEITDFDYQTAYTAFNVIINDPDRSSLIRKTSLAQQGFSFMNQSSCYVENAELCNLFFSNIPGNARSNYQYDQTGDLLFAKR